MTWALEQQSTRDKDNKLLQTQGQQRQQQQQQQQKGNCQHYESGRQFLY